MNRVYSRWSFLATILLGLSTSLPTLAAPREKTTDKVFVGYLYGAPTNIHFGLYTHLCHAFLVADGEGRIQNPGTFRAERSQPRHKAGVKVLLSLGGWGWDGQFASLVSKPVTEDRYVKSVLDVVNDYGYDGIDLDWEYPDTEQEVIGFERSPAGSGANSMRSGPGTGRPRS